MKIGDKVGIFKIEKVILEGKEYVCCLTHKGEYVTWHKDVNGNSYSYGHYFSNEDDAVIDFYKRTYDIHGLIDYFESCGLNSKMAVDKAYDLMYK